MDIEIKNRYNDVILQDAIRRFGIDKSSVELLDGFESFIYEVARQGKSYILRISHSLRRSTALIQGELDWLNYLSDNGISVARAIPSNNGRLVEAIRDAGDGDFLAAVFVKAEGKEPGDWPPQLVNKLGETLGAMHHLSKHYEPSDERYARLHWDDRIMLEVEFVLPESEHVVLSKYFELRDHLAMLERDRDSYGLIHQDAHAGNFFVDEAGGITLFDFDDACYSWYVNDIAIVLFYAVMGSEDRHAFTRFFMEHFLKGYRNKNSLDGKWLKQIPHFLKLREIDLYAVIHRSFDLDNIDDPFAENFMKRRQERLESGTPYIDFDFHSMGIFLSTD